MSPVKQSKARSPRSLVLAVAGVVVGLALLLVVFVVAVPSLTESGTVEVNLGDDVFNARGAESRAETIAESGPILFPDVSGRNDRDIYLQHLGDDPEQGWYAFDARRPGQGRECTLDWDGSAQEFRDPCDGTVVPADGAGLLSYPVEVSEDGDVVVDLNPDEEPPDATGGG
jgi:hypothetical protein